LIARLLITGVSKFGIAAIVAYQTGAGKDDGVNG
jgi:hypothetical protein